MWSQWMHYKSYSNEFSHLNDRLADERGYIKGKAGGMKVQQSLLLGYCC